MKFNGVRFISALLLVLVIILTLSGIYGLFWTTTGWVFTVHRISGWALLALLPWKLVIIFRSLRRKLNHQSARHFHPGWLSNSLLLAVLTFVVLALGLLWKGRFGPVDYPLRQSAVSWHWMLALGLLVPFALHVWKRWPRPRRVDFASRRALIRSAVIAPLAVVGYLIYERVADVRQHPQSPFRFTGSRLAGWFSGNDFPLTHNTAPDPAQIDVSRWQLEISGAVTQPMQFNYDRLSQIKAAQLDATIDCTLGWYARQDWRGLMLADLLSHAGLARTPTAVRLVSVTGYESTLPWIEAQNILLATHVGGEPLSAGHGFPLRAVVPSRRGWFWVKWLSTIEVLDDPFYGITLPG